jgi:D-alanine-D-alanine ligase
MRKKNIALLAGGYTGESVISQKSAQTVLKHLDAEKYQVYLIQVDQSSWYHEDAKLGKIQVNKDDFSLVFPEEKVNFDLAFIMIHGSPGEDGKLQGYFDMLGIPYNTCDATSSAITMNKAYTKALIADLPGVHIAKSLQLRIQDGTTAEQVLAQLRLPLFVKPNTGGSSIGMSKVKEADALAEAMVRAFAEDPEIIIEEFISGREFTVGVYMDRGEIVVMPATEIVSSKEFFDYEAKYTTGVSQEITPGRMSDEELLKVRSMMPQIYRRLNCKGVVRIDYIIEDQSNEPFILEVNTVPGQSENSIIPQQVRAMGMSLQEFYGNLVESSISNK